MKPSREEFRRESVAMIDKWDRLRAQLSTSIVPESRKYAAQLDALVSLERAKLAAGGGGIARYYVAPVQSENLSPNPHLAASRKGGAK